MDELGAAQNPPRSECCIAAPPILEFDSEGNLLKSFGGPGKGYDWPASEHGIHIDEKGNIWIAGNAPVDRQVLKFSSEGKFLLQIGHPAPATQTADSSSHVLLGRPSGMAVDDEAPRGIHFVLGRGLRFRKRADCGEDNAKRK